jgi:hypothetical protein
MSSIALSMSPIFWLPRSAMLRVLLARSLASEAFPAFALVWAAICSTEADSSSSALACSVLPCASCSPESSICREPAATCSAAARMFAMMLLMLMDTVCNALASTPISLFWRTSKSTFISPTANFSAARIMWRTGFAIRFAMVNATPALSSASRAAAASRIHCSWSTSWNTSDWGAVSAIYQGVPWMDA